jgi:iron-sulfur cluster insertion protein
MTDVQVISMTENAARRVAEIAAKLGKEPVLRLSVEGGGCSGFQYKFGMAESIEDDDVRAEGNGASLVVDPVSLDLVRGSAVDFVESLGGKSFQVTNPNAQAGCGCGSSFAV